MSYWRWLTSYREFYKALTRDRSNSYGGLSVQKCAGSSFFYWKGNARAGRLYSSHDRSAAAGAQHFSFCFAAGVQHPSPIFCDGCRKSSDFPRRRGAHGTFLSVLQWACSIPPLFFATDAEKTAIPHGGGGRTALFFLFCSGRAAPLPYFLRRMPKRQRFPTVAGGPRSKRMVRRFFRVSAWCGKIQAFSQQRGYARKAFSRRRGASSQQAHGARKAFSRRRGLPRSKHMVRRFFRVSAGRGEIQAFSQQRGHGAQGILAAGVSSQQKRMVRKAFSRRRGSLAAST